MSYRRDDVKAPRVSGLALKAFVAALESPAGAVLLDKLVKDSGIDRWRDTPVDAPPLQLPLPHPPAPPSIPSAHDQAAAALREPSPGRETVSAFVKAYREGADVEAVIRRVHEHIERLDGRDERLGLFISRKPEQVLEAARASSQRHREGKPLSVLDGVPVVLKDEVDLAGFPTTLGTRFREEVASTDSTVAARLKAAGAIILGKANMNEIGINPIGLNPWHGAARNPWNHHHITGGSSSASAAVVAAGLCPMSIGADGGGSIRIPASLCGVVGLKATWGRIPETGVPPLCWNVGHVGPLGLTVDDVAAAYALLAGADGHDVVANMQPAPHLHGLDDGALNGLRVGLCRAWFEDADREVVQKSYAALDSLKRAGASVVELDGPDMNTVLWTHSCLILSEMASAMRAETKKDSTRFALDSRTNLAIGRHFRGTDYVHALRHRHAMTRDWLGFFSRCDVFISPTCAITAPPIPESTLPDGESNLPVVDALMRFIRVANLTGFPALSLPAGFDSQGLPVGVHLMGRPYEESLLLRLGRIIEREIEVRTPRWHAAVL